MRISTELERRLVERAAAEGCTVESLLSRWVSTVGRDTDDVAQPSDDGTIDDLDDDSGLYTSLHQFNILLRSFAAFAYRCHNDRNWTMQVITDGCELVTGYPSEALQDNAEVSYREIIHPDDRTYVESEVNHGILNQQPFHITYRIIDRDGNLRWVWEQGIGMWNGYGSADTIEGLVLDITERKNAEDALRQERNQLNSITETVPLGVLLIQRDGRITFANSLAEKILAVDRRVIKQRTYNASEWHVTDANGTPVHESELVFARVLRIGQALRDVEQHYMRPDGTSVLLSINGTPILDSEGEINSVVLAFADITEQRRAELEAREVARLRTNLRREREHNTLVRNIIATLSHDLRTPLSIISTAQGMLSQYFDRISEDKRREKLDIIKNQLQLVTQMLDNLKSAVRDQVETNTIYPVKTNLTSLCKVMVDELQQTTAIGYHIDFVTDQPLILANVDQTCVNRILLNLLSNAIKYSPAGSHVRLLLTQEDDHVVFQVRDQGVGIPEHDVPHIFQATFRSSNVKQSEPGAGLGLSIAKECVDLHNGTIEVYSRLNEGTTFIVRLPVNIPAPRVDAR